MVSENIAVRVFKMPGHSTSQTAKHWSLHRLALFHVSQCYSQTGFTVKEHWPLPESRELTMSSVASPSRPRMRYTIGIGSPWNNTEQPWKQGHQLSTEQHKTAMETVVSTLHKTATETVASSLNKTTQNGYGNVCQFSLKQHRTDTETGVSTLPETTRNRHGNGTTHLTDRDADWCRQSGQPTSPCSGSQTFL